MKFYKIYLELSDICHLKCSFCKPKKAVRGLMPLALFDTITSQIQNKTRLVSLHILGDPLCIDNLATYLDIAEQKKIYLDIVSSGIYLQHKHFPILCRNNIHQISFSLDALYDKNNQRNIQIAYGTTIQENYILHYFDTIFALYKYLQENHANIYMNLRLFNHQQYDYILQRFPNAIWQNSKRRIRLEQHLFLRFHKKFTWHTNSQMINKSRITDTTYMSKTNDTYTHSINAKTQIPHCYGSIKQLGILANGIVVPCCLDARGNLCLGDLKTQSFAHILQSRRFLDFQHAQQTATHLPYMCQICTFRGV